MERRAGRGSLRATAAVQEVIRISQCSQDRGAGLYPSECTAHSCTYGQEMDASWAERLALLRLIHRRVCCTVCHFRTTCPRDPKRRSSNAAQSERTGVLRLDRCRRNGGYADHLGGGALRPWRADPSTRTGIRLERGGNLGRHLDWPPAFRPDGVNRRAADGSLRPASVDGDWPSAHRRQHVNERGDDAVVAARPPLGCCERHRHRDGGDGTRRGGRKPLVRGETRAGDGHLRGGQRQQANCSSCN